jgi:predicted metal-dependent enzyme (double-stranded beta helix superfamily)
MPSPVAVEPALDHDRLERLLASLLGRIDAGHEIPGTGRRYERLTLDGDLGERVDAWLIAWPAGTGLGMHDHQGSDAVLTVLRSSLRERYLDGGAVRQRTLQPGRSVRLAADHVHEVVNANGVEALSLHLYSPPLRSTDFRADKAIEVMVVPEG